MEEEVLDAEVVEGTTTQELVHSPQKPVTLFRTDDPVEVVQKASEAASALKDVIDKQGLTTRIKDKDHVNVEGWQTLGSMLGVFPILEWTRKVENGWEARVEAKTLSGAVVGAGESQCLRTESRGPWKSADDYALRSMAQTRATSKALASALRFVMTLAGYESTPADEMPAPPGQIEEASPELQQRVQEALAYLLPPDFVEQTWLRLLADNDGKLPRQVGRALLFTAAALRDATITNTQSQEEEVGSNDAAGADEPAGEHREVSDPGPDE